MTETNLFIIWENARYKSREILDDMNKEFKILKIFEVEWEKSKFSKNLTRFYGTNLPPRSDKETHCGNGKFLLIILDDEKCKYENRNTSKGVQYVNTHMFDCKKKYRSWTNGGHKIHGTNSEVETNHDLTLLIGKNIEDFKSYLEKNPWNGEIEALNSNLLGTDGWNCIEDVFYVLNNGCEYAILRNYEEINSNVYCNGHEDIDLLCRDKKEVEYLLGCKAKFKQKYRVHYFINVNNQKVMVDLRHVGDGYYDKSWQMDMLERRVYNEEGYYTLCLNDYYYSLIYHAILQKPMFSYDYENRLQIMASKLGKSILVGESEFLRELNLFMNENKYKYTVCDDYSVFFKFDKVKEFEKISLIAKYRRLLKINRMNIYDKPINMMYKIQKYIWLLRGEKELKQSLAEKGIENLERYNFKRWVRKGKFYIGTKNENKVFIKVSDKYSSALSEIESMKRLNQRKDTENKYFNIVDYSETHKSPYIVFEYSNIVTLKEYIDKNKSLKEEELELLMKFLDSVLRELHNNKIIHRDIRPENISVNIKHNKVIGYQIFDFGYSVVNNNDYFDINNKYDKHVLIRLGKEYKYSQMKWDDAASMIRVIQYADKYAMEKFPTEFNNIKSKLGKNCLTY